MNKEVSRSLTNAAHRRSHDYASPWHRPEAGSPLGPEITLLKGMVQTHS